MENWYKTKKSMDYFKDGKLYRFRARNVKVIRFWGENSGAWIKEKDKPYWRHFRPQKKFLPTSNKKIRWATEEIPDEVKKKIEKFTTRQWHLLQVLNRCGKAAMDLAETNLPLLFMLGSSWVFNKNIVSGRHLRKVRRLLRKKRKEIVAELGFPESNYIVKLISKVEPEIIWNITNFLYLRDSLHNLSEEMRKILYHVPKVDKSIYKFINDRESHPHLASKLMMDIARVEKDDDIYSTFKDTVRMLRQNYGNNIPEILDLEHLRNLHEELIDRYRRPGVISHVQFSEEPIPGTKGIEPLRSSLDLYYEGKEQHNCVASYTLFVLAGYGYVYRILYPERATLAIRKTRDGWVIDQIKGPCNAEVKKETVEYVKSWLSTVSVLGFNPNYKYLKLFDE